MNKFLVVLVLLLTNLVISVAPENKIRLKPRFVDTIAMLISSIIVLKFLIKIILNLVV